MESSWRFSKRVGKDPAKTKGSTIYLRTMYVHYEVKETLRVPEDHCIGDLMVTYLLRKINTFTMVRGI